MTNHLLIEARKQAGLSQIQVAEKIGVSKATLNRWEQAKSLPYRLHQKKLCALYQKTEQELGLLPMLLSEKAEVVLSSFDSLIPVLPPTPLIGRDWELAQLKTSLFGGQTVALNALNGLPGVGKTALAIALAHDPEVRAHFTDGILWTGLGPNPDVPNHLSHWGTLLGLPSGEMRTLAGPQAWAVALRRAIGSQRMLLIIDDAWTLEDALTFHVGGPQCAHLVTTRFPHIAMQSSTVLTLQELHLTESLALLRELAPRVVEQERDRVGELIKAENYIYYF